MEIVPGLHRLRTPMTSEALPWIMPYAFEGPEGVSLFDSGYGTDEAVDSLWGQLRELGYAPSDIRRLIVSHGHPDHLGMAKRIAEASPGCELIMLGREADWFTARRREMAPSAGADFVARMRAWLVRHGMPAEQAAESARGDDHRHGAPDGGAGASGAGAVASEIARRAWTMPDVEVDVRLEDGDVIEFDGWRLIALWTPGHTPGHLCVYEPRHALMFTGDHVLSRITPNVSLFEDDERTGRRPLEEFLGSLDRVAGYATRLGLPAHERVIEDLPGRCVELREHHERRLEEVCAGIGDGAATANDISSRVTWSRPYATFGVFQRRSALGETLAHLQLLERDGRARRVEDGDGGTPVVRWERTHA